MKRIINYCLAFLLFTACNSQPDTIVPEAYQEMLNPKATNKVAWQRANPGVSAAFASPDVRYKKEALPELQTIEPWKGKGWKGEKINTKILLWTTDSVDAVRFSKGELKSAEGKSIPAENISVNFIRYVMTDSIGRKGMGCGIESDLDSSLAEDAIDNISSLALAANSTQPVWLSVRIPGDAAAGVYSGTIEVDAAGKKLSLDYTVEVLNRTLPAPADWSFHLDLWQNPFSIARFHNVKEWSDEHMKAMTPYMQMLANAGQKVITTSIIHDPWNSQTFDVYKSMVKWVKKKDGTWSYDYSIFDKWVTYMMSLGIDKEINCYSMIPWNLKFYYHDETLGRDTVLIDTPGTAGYEKHWKPMLANFSAHLKEKGWFEKTTIAMDERPMEHMQLALAIIRGADKDFKVSMAGNYHKEIEKELYDYCVASQFILPDEIMKRRKKDGFITTYYTACPEEYPNVFTFSPPAESAFLGWYAAAKGFDGYLRWAYNSWPEKPLQDSRFGHWSAGDTSFIYPEGRSSVRFERLIEGIQAFEKIRILMNEFNSKNEVSKSEQLQKALKSFDIPTTKKTGAAAIVNDANTVLNSF
jgi:glycosyl hydrolase family 123